LDPLVFLELALAAVNAMTVALAIRLGNWVIAFYATLFMAGLLFTSGLTISQTIVVWRRRMQPKPQSL
jgi:hypothetical protein